MLCTESGGIAAKKLYQCRLGGEAIDEFAAARERGPGLPFLSVRDTELLPLQHTHPQTLDSLALLAGPICSLLDHGRITAHFRRVHMPRSRVRNDVVYGALS
jgi:hypothetical protein